MHGFASNYPRRITRHVRSGLSNLSNHRYFVVSWRAARMFCFKLVRSSTLPINACARSSSAEALRSTSTSRHLFRKSVSSGESLDLSRTSGRPLDAMRYRALSGVSLRYGGSPSIISMMSMPRLQMSTLYPYCFLRVCQLSTIINVYRVFTTQLSYSGSIVLYFSGFFKLQV